MTGPPPMAKKKGRFGKPKKELPPQKIVLNTVEGWGKTTIAANIPDVSLIIAPMERGYETLFATGRVPEVPYAVAESWMDLNALVDEVSTGWIALDALGGMEKLCHDYVMANNFKSDREKFLHFHKGPELAGGGEWLKFLAKLENTGKNILFLAHSKVKAFSDPLADNYDRYIVDANKHTWSPMMKWANAVFFGTFQAVMKKSKGDVKAKGIGGNERIMFTEHRDAFDAKNHYGLPAEMSIPDDPKAGWSTIWTAIQAAIAKGI